MFSRFSVRSANKTIKYSDDSIPIDLIIEILSRLPAKSIARFRCVSKLWASILGRPYFKELFLTRSTDHPRLLFAIQQKDVWSFFSLLQHQNSSSSLELAAEFQVKLPTDNMRIYTSSNRGYVSCCYASGLAYLNGMWIKKKDYYIAISMICNPNTGQYTTLPSLNRSKPSSSFFVFEPIEKQYKVLFMAYTFSHDHHNILTLGTGKMKWREIKCSLRHKIMSEGICINGVLYYFADTSCFVKNDADLETSDFVIVCFDARYEKFEFIDVEVNGCCELINYNGKLGVICWEDDGNLRLWILEDVENQEWSKYAYTLRDDDKFSPRCVSVVGVTASGEIVFSMDEYTVKQPFYVFYFNPEKNILQRVEIQGFREYYREGFKNHGVYTFVNHVEDLNVNDAKLLKSSIYAPYVNKDAEEESEEEDIDHNWSY